MYHPDGAQPERFNETLFKARLMPYRSLGRNGFYILMGCLISCWLIVSIVFASLGAWPIFGFFGLDIALIYLAFRWNYRAANAREEISISRASLKISQHSASGKIITYNFNPFWTRFQIFRKPEFGITSMIISNREKSISIGQFLSPDAKEDFAAAFSQALNKARH